MTNDPYIKWTPIRFRKQGHLQCVANALSAFFEKTKELAGVDMEIIAEDLDAYLRKELKVERNRGLYVRKCLKVLRKEWNGVSVKWYNKRVNVDGIRKALINGPVLVSFKTYKRKGSRVKDGVYLPITNERRGSHLTLVIGWDSDTKQYLVLDSNYKKIVRMDYDNMVARFNKFFLIKLN